MIFRSSGEKNTIFTMPKSSDALRIELHRWRFPWIYFFQMHIDFMRAAVPLHHHPDMGFLPVKLDDFAVLAAAVRFCRTREI